MSWIEATKLAIYRQLGTDTSRRFSRKELVENQLQQIVHDTNSKGKTPENTLSYYLQVLRDKKFIDFIDNNGLYQLRPEYQIVSKPELDLNSEPILNIKFDLESETEVESDLEPEIEADIEETTDEIEVASAVEENLSKIDLVAKRFKDNLSDLQYCSALKKSSGYEECIASIIDGVYQSKAYWDLYIEINEDIQLIELKKGSDFHVNKFKYVEVFLKKNENATKDVIIVFLHLNRNKEIRMISIIETDIIIEAMGLNSIDDCEILYKFYENDIELTREFSSKGNGRKSCYQFNFSSKHIESIATRNIKLN